MKPASGPYLPSRYYALFCDWLKTVGVDVPRLLAAAGIAPDQVYGPEGALTVPQVEALVHESIAATGRTDVGIDCGRLIKLSSHDILGFGILSSPTLDYAVRLAVRFYRLMTPTFRMAYRRDAHKAEVDFTPMLSLNPEALRFHFEMISVSAHEQIKVLLDGALPAYDIYLSTAQPADPARYRELAPARWHFEALPTPGIRMVLRADLFDRVLRMSDRSALQMAEARCEALLQRVTQEGGLAPWVEMMLREAHDGMPTLEDLAHILHLTSRTLDRRLQREGHRFLQLSKRVRHDKARALLGGGGLSVTQVALQLGYHDAANFTRAFRREAGMSPSAFAAQAAVTSGPQPHGRAGRPRGPRR